MADIVGRSVPLGLIDAAMTALTAGARARGLLVQGLNRSGRSTFLQLAARTATDRGWVQVAAAFPKGQPAGLAERHAIAAVAEELARRRPGASAVGRLQRAAQLAMAEPQEPFPNLGAELTEALESTRCGVLVTLDDAPASGSDLESLAAPTETGLPFLAVIATPAGFPPSSRFDAIELGPLEQCELAGLLTRTNNDRTNNDRSVQELERASGGWPWLAVALADAPSACWPEVTASLGGQLLGPLSGTERRYLNTVAALGSGPAELTQVARSLGDTTRFSAESSALAGVRDALTTKGLVYQPDPATVDLAVAGMRLVLARR